MWPFRLEAGWPNATFRESALSLSGNIFAGPTPGNLRGSDGSDLSGDSGGFVKGSSDSY